MTYVAALQPGDPEHVGGYRLLERLGAGGMGRVFLGVSPAGQHVAVKMILTEHATDDEFRARFRREVTAARRVGGLYTAAVVDADPDATPPWMATAYVRGPSLHQHVAAHGPLPAPEAARLGAALAEGLAAIHQCGLIHRDLKPGNIMLAGDRPRIIDFGIARVTDASILTRTGTLLGTYAYMSPEQVEQRPLGPASDVFALGGVLVFAATGHAPFDVTNELALALHISARPPSLDGIGDGPLRQLIADCLAKDAARRPALGDLLPRLTAMAPAAAPAPPPTELAPPRDPRPGGPAGPSGALLMRVTGDGGMPLGRVAFSPDGRIVAGSAAQPGTGGGHWRVYLWDIATGLPAAAPLEGPLAGPGAPGGGRADAPRLAFSPDGRLLAVTGTGGAGLWRTGTWRPASLQSDAATAWQAIAFSPNGYVLATIAGTVSEHGFSGTRIRLWSTETLRPLDRTFLLDAAVSGEAVRFSPDGRFLLAGTAGALFLWDMSARALGFERVDGYDGLPGQAAFSGDGLLVAARSASPADVAVLGSRSRQPAAWLNCDQPVSLLDFSPAAALVATATGDRGQPSADAWSVAGREVTRHRLDGFPAVARTLRFSPDGEFLAAAGAAGRGTDLVRVWRADGTWRGASMTIAGPAVPAFSPDGRYFAVSAADQTVLLRETRARRPPVVLGHPASGPGTPGPGTPGPGTPARGLSEPRAMAFSSDSRVLATTDRDGTRLWHLP
ncbi:MAG TPA: serine/threonine-protein kinase [Trebonia sp.]|nr:serine/threonine-protein kinase [Trebonia sp.]